MLSAFPTRMHAVYGSLPPSLALTMCGGGARVTLALPLIGWGRGTPCDAATSGRQYGPDGHKKDSTSKLVKYGVPLAAGVGGAYALSQIGFGHGFCRGSSSSSSSSEEE